MRMKKFIFFVGTFNGWVLIGTYNTLECIMETLEKIFPKLKEPLRNW